MRRRRVLLLGGGVGVSAALGTPMPRARAQGPAVLPLQLLRTGDIGGLPWVELPLGGRATRWLVDSGASIALIAPALAQALKLERRADLRVAGAGGVQRLPRFALPPLPLPTAAARAEAAALDLASLLGPAGATLDGLIGAPWLREAVTRFDFARGELSWPQRAAAPAGPSAQLPLRWDAGLPVLSLALGERRAEPFLFDTGNAGALVLFAQRARTLLEATAALPASTVRELGGSVRALHARIERVSAAGWTMRELPAAFESGAPGERGAHFDRLSGSLGCAAFEAGAVTLDGPGGRLLVELPGLPEPAPLAGGFGLRLEAGGAAPRVAAVFDAGPAAAAGIAPGQWLLGLDDADAHGWPPEQVWQRLAGRTQAEFALGTEAADAAPRRVTLRREAFFPLWR